MKTILVNVIFDVDTAKQVNILCGAHNSKLNVTSSILHDFKLKIENMPRSLVCCMHKDIIDRS